MGEEELDYYTTKLTNDKNCIGLIYKEDHHQTTIFPACNCNRKYCSEYKGYCAVRGR